MGQKERHANEYCYKNSKHFCCIYCVPSAFWALTSSYELIQKPYDVCIVILSLLFFLGIKIYYIYRILLLTNADRQGYHGMGGRTASSLESEQVGWFGASCHAGWPVRWESTCQSAGTSGRPVTALGVRCLPI